MTEVVNVLLIIFYFVFFGFIHSVLASNKVKCFLLRKKRGLIPFYRIFYNILAVIMLFLIYINLPASDIVIYDLPKPFDFIILIFQFLSLIGLVWTLRYFSVKEFLGITQIEIWFKGKYNFNELDEKLSLRIEGPYKFVRHPLYLFSILFLIFRPYMDFYYLTIVICITAYFYIGSMYEERKLVEEFGKKYEAYQKEVPRIFTLNPFHPYKPGPV